MGGGAAGSGEVNYPQYLEETHQNWLFGSTFTFDPLDVDHVTTLSMNEIINTAHGAGGNPYEGETAYNPNAALTLTANSPLARMVTAHDAAATMINALSTSLDWGTLVDTAYGKFSKFPDPNFLASMSSAITSLLSTLSSVLAGSYITNLVTAYENAKKPRFLRNIGMWAAGMADINAVNTSSFVIGMALRQKDFEDEVDGYQRELQQSLFGGTVQTALQGYVQAQVTSIDGKGKMLLVGPESAIKAEEVEAQTKNFAAQLMTELARIRTEIERLTIIAKKEHEEADLHIDIQEALWDFEVYMYAGNLMGAIAGAAAGRKEASSIGQSAMSGALSGASIGGNFGPVGAGVGAVAGGLLGLASG
jgi:hypothetical protein